MSDWKDTRIRPGIGEFRHRVQVCDAGKAVLSNPGAIIEIVETRSGGDATIRVRLCAVPSSGSIIFRGRQFAVRSVVECPNRDSLCRAYGPPKV